MLLEVAIDLRGGPRQPSVDKGPGIPSVPYEIDMGREVRRRVHSVDLMDSRKYLGHAITAGAKGARIK